MVKTKPANTPSFAACRVEHWDDEKNQPDPLEAEDYEDGDVKEAVDRFLADYDAWRRIQADPAEANARRNHAERAVSYLVGLYPNARVNPEAYASAAGEDLAEYSADIVKMVVERARRTSKTLPTIAALLDMAASEAERRHQQAAVYRRAVEEHAAAIVRGKRQAEDYAKAAAAFAPDLDAEAVEALWREVTHDRIGITSRRQSASVKAGASAVVVLLARVGKGDQRAADVLRGILAERREYVDAEQAAEQAGDEDGAFNAWMQRFGAREGWRARVVAAAVPEPAQPPPRPPGGPVLPAGGRRVTHKKFGRGTITHEDGDRITVAFDTHGEKLVLAAFLAPAEQAAATDPHHSEQE